MSTGSKNTEQLLALIRGGHAMTFRTQLRLTAMLSVPAIVAQLSSIAMQYIDASMVGSLGANASASIGLVSTTTWLFWGVLSAAGTGFSVQVAHLIGSGDFEKARKVVRQAFVSLLIFSTVIALTGVAISPFLPAWLGADEMIHRDASRYFLIFASFLPALQINFLAGSMLRCAGNMKIPSMLNVMMCLIDVVLNFILIFPERDISLGSWHLHIWGAGLGVEGAALATVLAETIVATIMLWYLWCRSPILSLWKRPGSFMPKSSTLRKALKIGMPMGLEHIAICSAQIIITTIVAPLGVVAIAANAFAIIAESLCYMPGYGIGEAATTLAGQAYGAGRHKLVRRFGYITVGAAMAVMGFMGVALYVFAPQIISIMSPVEEIRLLGAEILRIEAWAEPMFGAAIVSYGFFVGLGRTILPSIMNLLSIWGVRITLATLLAPAMGLKGVWLAMCIELCFRGLIFLALLVFGRWRKETDTRNKQHLQ